MHPTANHPNPEKHAQAAADDPKRWPKNPVARLTEYGKLLQ
jgi:hypothetical protein